MSDNSHRSIYSFTNTLMLLNVLLLIAGLVLILWGANKLTDGSSAVARSLGISDLVVGLTIVAFGTSAPELVISVISAAEGNAPLAIGNVVGSNIFNILVIIGITAIVRPIVIKRSIMTMEMPMVILAATILLALGNSGILDGTGVNTISRVNGIFLLILLLLFVRYTFAVAKQPGEDPNLSAEHSQDSDKPKPLSPLKSVIFIILGLGALIWGGDIFVAQASSIATALGVSQAVIGLTIVAAGTSLPELATSVVAAIKGQSGLAVGNVIGSNILNVLLVLGVSSVITPLPFGTIGNIDLLTLAGASVAFLIFGWIIGHHTITRFEGCLLFGAYVAYISVLLSRL